MDTPTCNTHFTRALDSLSQGRDLLEYMTSVTEHATSDSSINGRDLILASALEHIQTAEAHIKAIHQGGAA